MVKEKYIVKVYNENNELVVDSIESYEYPTKEKIEFGLKYAPKGYVKVEKRYVLEENE